jgi:hypothetical protein
MVSWESLSWSENSSPFMEPESALHYSQEPATALYPEPLESCFFKIHLKTALLFTRRSPKCSFAFRFLNSTSCAFLVSTRYTYRPGDEQAYLNKITSSIFLGVGIHKWYSAGLRAECDRWFKSRQKLGIFLFTTVSRSALGPSQLPIQGVLGVLSLR